MTRYDHTLEDAIVAAGHPVRCAWQMPGPETTMIESMECLVINGHTVIVQTIQGGGWDAYTPSRTNSIDQTIRDVMTICGITTGDPEYLARFPEDQRATADAAYQDGFQDGVDPESVRAEALRQDCGGEMWGEHPEQRRADWRDEVVQEKTSLGYWEWAAARIADEN